MDQLEDHLLSVAVKFSSDGMPFAGLDHHGARFRVVRFVAAQTCTAKSVP